MTTRRTIVGVLVLASAIAGCRDPETLSPPLAQQAAGASAAGTGAGGTGTAGANTAGRGPAAGTGAGGSAAAAGAAAPVTASSTDYANPSNWLCRPGQNAACETNIDATVVKADGTLTPEPFIANAAAPIDCFYVYPTVSLDATPNSDLVAGPEENAVVQTQLARLGSQCRLFAPLYRQVTLTALRAQLGGMVGMPPDRTLGYSDVLAAWQHYLENDNKGRGIVLVGHSQGSSVLTQLIRDHLDKTPVDSKLLAALLIGSSVTVPKGAVVGGTFKNLPLCKSADELGCVITYASFRADVPPPPMSLFGRAMDPNQIVGCTNPAALGGGPAELHAYLSAKGSSVSSAPMPAWTTPEQAITTPYVNPPGLITGECVSNENGSYLAIKVNADPADPRVDDIVGDVMTNGMVSKEWGLHLIDINLTMGNLVDVVKAKAAAFAAR